VLEEERVEYLKTTLWSYTNLVSACCVSDDESMERIRQDLEKINVADDIAAFINTFGTGAPDPGLARAQTHRTSEAEPKDAGSESEDDSPELRPHGSAVPAPASHNATNSLHSSSSYNAPSSNSYNAPSSNSYSGPGSSPYNGPNGNPANTVGSNGNAMNTVNSNTMNSNAMNTISTNGTARSGSILASRPQTQESMRQQQRPASMHAQPPMQPMMNGNSPSWNGRPTSAMHGAMPPDNTYRRASNNDMYAMANGMQQHQQQQQQQQQFVQRTNSQMAMYAGGMDPRAPSSMSAYRAGGGTNSPVPMASQPPGNMNMYRASGGTNSPVPMASQPPQQQQQHMHQHPHQPRPGTPSQMDAYGMAPPRMESPRSRAGTFNAPAHTGNFGTLTGTAQMQPFAGHHQSGSAPGSPYQQPVPVSRPSSAMG
ncbi:formin-binding protein, partial [Coemansia sp. RSA 2618]